MTALARFISSTTNRVRASLRWLTLSLAGIAFVIIFGLPTLIIPLATDQVLYALGARTILDGGQLYRDFWEIKPPLVFLIYTIPLAAAGDHMEAVRGLDLANTALTMAAVFFLSRRFFGERAAVLAAVFYAFTYLTWEGFESLAEAESFMAAPLAFAFFLYRPEDDSRGVTARAVASGALLGAVFGLKATGLLFVFGLPAAELLLRRDGSWTPRGALRRLLLAALGFLVVQAALVGYLALGGVLDEFIDIQRHYTAPYNAFRYAPDGSHARFLLQAISDWIEMTPYLVVPAAVAIFFAFYRPLRAPGVYLIAWLALLAVLGIWWQGKMFRYHWLIMFPLLAPLAGYAVDEVLALFSRLRCRQAWLASTLLAGGITVLAFQPLLNTYDNYRTFVSYADGSLSRREVEARYNFLLPANHELADYVSAHGDQDDRLFIWGLWPFPYYWLDLPLVSRFVGNHGLRATWAPESWRRELIDDLEEASPRFFAVALGDRQPWLVGTSQTSDEHLRDSFPELRRFLEEHYVPVREMQLFILYERAPVAVTAPDPPRVDTRFGAWLHCRRGASSTSCTSNRAPRGTSHPE